jgi:hypothetical protein
MSAQSIAFCAAIDRRNSQIYKLKTGCPIKREALGMKRERGQDQPFGGSDAAAAPATVRSERPFT